MNMLLPPLSQPPFLFSVYGVSLLCLQHLNLGALLFMPGVSLESIAIFIAAFLITLFFPFLHSEFILDDGHKIVENYDIRDWTRLPWSLFPKYDQGERDLLLQFKMNRNDPSRPLTFAMYTLEYRVAGGAHPWIFRIVNVFLHGSNGILLYSLLNLLHERLFSRNSASTGLSFQFAAATLFWVFCPLNISTANYAYSRSEILGFTIELCCFHLLLRGHNRHLAVGCATLLALFAKQSYVCIVPCVFVFFLLFPSICLDSSSDNQSHSAVQSRVSADIRRALRRSFPCILPSVLYMGYRLCYLGGLGDLEADPSNRPVPYLHYLRTQPFAIFSYFMITIRGGMAVDHGVLVDDPVPILIPCVVVASVFVLSCAVVYKAPFGVKSVIFGWVFAFAHLAPTSLLVTTDVMADRRFYVASFPFLLFLCTVVDSLRSNSTQNYAQQQNSPKDTVASMSIAVGCFGLLLMLCATGSYNHLSAYRDNISAWRSVLNLYPNSVRAHNNLATSLIKKCRSCPPGENFALQSDCAAPLMGEALAHFQWLTRRDPRDHIALSNIGDILCSPTLSHANSVQNCTEAEYVLHRAIQSNPRFSSSAYNLALFYQRMNFYNDAEHWYLHAIAQNPHHVLSYNNLGVLYMNIGKKSLALHYFKAGLAADPDSQLILSNIPSVSDARVLGVSDIKRAFQEPSVCNVAPVCVSAQRAGAWGKLLTAPLARTTTHPRPPHPLASVGNGPVNFATSFSEKVNLISAPDDSDIPEHATPVQLRPDDYLQLLERALRDQPNNLHFRKLAIETCDNLGRAECGQRHRNLLNSFHSHHTTQGLASGKTQRKKTQHDDKKN